MRYDRTSNRYNDKMVKRYSDKTVKRYNEGGEGKFQAFEDLDVYQVAREFRKLLYTTSRRLPDFEKFELASQIRPVVTI
jgi:hypothetical protein